MLANVRIEVSVRLGLRLKLHLSLGFWLGSELMLGLWIRLVLGRVEAKNRLTSGLSFHPGVMLGGTY